VSLGYVEKYLSYQGHGIKYALSSAGRITVQHSHKLGRLIGVVGFELSQDV